MMMMMMMQYFYLIVHDRVHIYGDVVASQNLKQGIFSTHLIVHDRIHKNGDAVFGQNLKQNVLTETASSSKLNKMIINVVMIIEMVLMLIAQVQDNHDHQCNGNHDDCLSLG